MKKKDKEWEPLPPEFEHLDEEDAKKLRATQKL